MLEKGFTTPTLLQEPPHRSGVTKTLQTHPVQNNETEKRTLQKNDLTHWSRFTPIRDPEIKKAAPQRVRGLGSESLSDQAFIALIRRDKRDNRRATILA